MSEAGSRAARGRPPATLQDATPLSRGRIDVAVRMGWLLRMARLANPVEPCIRPKALIPRLHALGLPASESTISRLESGTLRSGPMVEGYEAALGLPPGSLRAPIEILCRTFFWAPQDCSSGKTMGLATPTLESVSAACEPVLAGEATGFEWLRFAEQLAHPAVIGLPLGLAEEAIGRLASELGRSLGNAYSTRYEALALLRCSRYGGAVLAVLREAVDDPHTQVIVDLMSAASEAPTVDLLDFIGPLLGHPSDIVSRGAALGLENMLAVGGLETSEWKALIDPFVLAYNTAVDGEPRWRWLSTLLRMLPREVGRAIVPDLATPPAALPLPPAEELTESHQSFATCTEMAARITEELGIPEQPLLGRMLFEAICDVRAVVEVTSTFLLMGLPFRSLVTGEILYAAANADDEMTRRGALRLAMSMRADCGPEAVIACDWLSADDVDVRLAGVTVLAHSGRLVDTRCLRRMVDNGGIERRHALYAAGMTGHPLLHALAADTRPDVRGAAQWWARQGRRVGG